MLPISMFLTRFLTAAPVFANVLLGFNTHLDRAPFRKDITLRAIQLSYAWAPSAGILCALLWAICNVALVS